VEGPGSWVATGLALSLAVALIVWVGLFSLWILRGGTGRANRWPYRDANPKILYDPGPGVVPLDVFPKPTLGPLVWMSWKAGAPPGWYAIDGRVRYWTGGVIRRWIDLPPPPGFENLDPTRSGWHLVGDKVRFWTGSMKDPWVDLPPLEQMADLMRSGKRSGAVSSPPGQKPE